MNYFLVSGCIFATAANEKLADTVWLVKIIEEPHADDYGFTIAQDQDFSVESTWKSWRNKTPNIFSKNENTMFFYKISAAYPFVNFEMNKNLYSLLQSDYCDVISCGDHFGMMHCSCLSKGYWIFTR